ncbi:PP2C family protein-serine/threonine phosphatase [Streptomyces sp. NPDC001296]
MGVEHAADPQQGLQDAVESIGTTLDGRKTCEELAAYVCARVCDAVAVDLLPEDPPSTPSATGSPPAMKRVVTVGRAGLLGAWSANDARPLSLRALIERLPVTVAPGGSASAGRQVMTVPLQGRDRSYGVLLGVRQGPPFSEGDVALAFFAARLAAVHLGHARYHSAVRGTVFRLQRALLAEPGRPHPNLDLATRYLPAGGGTLVGGDWFETVRLHFGRTLLVMGDVMGHGLDAAVDMNAYRSMLRYMASTDLPPHRVLRRLDAAVYEEGTRRPATCLLAQVDPARGTASLTSAGHLPPALFAADGTGQLLDVPTGPPLGTGLGGYEPTTRPLTLQDTLLLFTDGLVERREEDIDVSLARLAGLRVRPGAGVEELLADVLDRLDAGHAEDDVAVLAARIRRRPEI